MDEQKNQVHAFRCNQCGWILGESYREGGRRITQLRIYRHPRPREDGLDMREIPVYLKYAATQANDTTVPCEHCGYCGNGNDWVANQTAIEDMLARRNQRRKVIDGLMSKQEASHG
jgi:hypothetical protein